MVFHCNIRDDSLSNISLLVYMYYSHRFVHTCCLGIHEYLPYLLPSYGQPDHNSHLEMHSQKQHLLFYYKFGKCRKHSTRCRLTPNVLIFTLNVINIIFSLLLSDWIFYWTYLLTGATINAGFFINSRIKKSFIIFLHNNCIFRANCCAGSTAATVLFLLTSITNLYSLHLLMQTKDTHMTSAGFLLTFYEHFQSLSLSSNN